MAETSNRDARLPGLEGLRGLMALWVVLGHCGNYLGHYPGANPPSWMKLFLLTSVPVDVFIALSGFVIFRMLSRRPETLYSRYIVRRARRILPIYLVAIALAVLFMSFRYEAYLLAPWRAMDSIIEYRAAYASTQDNLWFHVVAHVTLLHGLIPDDLLPNSAFAILAPAWSLSLEWQFYLIAPLLFAIVRWRESGIVVLLMAFSVISLFTLAYSIDWTPAFIGISWPFFAVGWWLSLFWHTPEMRHRLESRISRFVAAVLILGAAVYLSKDVRATSLSLLISVAGIAICAGILDGNRVFRHIRAFLSNRWLVTIGAASYSLYLLHVLVMAVLGFSMLTAGLFGHGVLVDYILLTFSTLAVSLLLSGFTYRYIEAPFIGGRKYAAPAAS